MILIMNSLSGREINLYFYSKNDKFEYVVRYGQVQFLEIVQDY